MNFVIRSEAFAVVLWVFGSLLLAALATPWIYGWGKDLAAGAAENDWNPAIEWLAASCERARISRYFNRALVASALLLLPLLLRRVRQLSRRKRGEIGAANPVLAKRVKWGWKLGLMQWGSGLVLAGGLLLVMGGVLVAAGAFSFQSSGSGPDAGDLFGKAVIPALGASLLEEWLFRGLLLGLWLRSTRPLPAAIGCSLLFAFVHFLQPPKYLEVQDPRDLLAGFELLGNIAQSFLDPRFIAAEFLTLFAVGLILALARLRTGALWWAVGMHAGWVFAFKVFNLWFESVPDSPLRPWWIGGDLKIGLLPLAMLAVTGLISIRFTRHFDAGSAPPTARLEQISGNP